MAIRNSGIRERRSTSWVRRQLRLNSVALAAARSSMNCRRAARERGANSKVTVHRSGSMLDRFRAVTDDQAVRRRAAKVCQRRVGQHGLHGGDLVPTVKNTATEPAWHNASKGAVSSGVPTTYSARKYSRGCPDLAQLGAEMKMGIGARGVRFTSSSANPASITVFPRPASPMTAYKPPVDILAATCVFRAARLPTGPFREHGSGA